MYRNIEALVDDEFVQTLEEVDSRSRSKDVTGAVELMEQLLERCLEESPVIPDWVCGRLASLYRTQKRFRDEVALIERFQASQTTPDCTRLNARLMKARACAERMKDSDSVMLESVRALRLVSKSRSIATASSEAKMASPAL